MEGKIKIEQSLEMVNNDVVLAPKTYSIGHSFCHHGEILQGVFYSDFHKDYVYGLTTFKCNLYYSKASFIKDENSNKIVVYPKHKFKAQEAAEKIVDYCKLSIGGSIEIHSNIIPKLGYGSSTADVLSTIRSITNLIELDLKEEVIAKLAILSEGASDSIMFKEEVLFAQRKGVVLDTYNKRFPAYVSLGFSHDSSDDGFDTLSMKPLRYSRRERLDFQELRTLLFHAFNNQDISMLGEVATRSALINQRYYPKSNLHEIIKICNKYDAVGVQVSHSGSLVGIIWNPDCLQIFDKIEIVKEELRRFNITSTWTFNNF